MSPPTTPLARYLAAYARLREDEGRGSGGEVELLALPDLTTGPLAAQWGVRRKTWRRFLRTVLAPAARRAGKELRVLDLGAGNGWACYRLSGLGHRAVALDARLDAVDGLGAARPYAAHLPRMFPRIAASFDRLPLSSGSFDIAFFNASLHYAASLSAALAEASRVVVPGGRVAILDSPFYRRAEEGDAMVEEKKVSTRRRYPALADDLLALPSIEYLTRGSLADAARPLGLSFRRRRVVYPFWYESRVLVAFVKRRRAPSRFDLWEALVP